VTAEPVTAEPVVAEPVVAPPPTPGPVSEEPSQGPVQVVEAGPVEHHSGPADPDAPVAHAWMPRPVCDDRCVVPVPGEPTVGRARRWARLAAAGAVLACAVPLALGYGLLDSRTRDAVLRGWNRAILTAFGVRLRVTGAIPAGGALLVANHVSWLDIVAIEAVRPTRMVAKHELRTWPLVGRLATAAGTLYLDRERLSTLPATVADIANALRAGDTVTMFPEGTTWCGRRGGPFRPAAFQAAIDAGAPVVPVALRFVLDGSRVTTATPAYVGSHSLWAVLCRTAALRGLTVEVQLLPAVPHDPAANRRTLAAAAGHAVATTR